MLPVCIIAADEIQLIVETADADAVVLFQGMKNPADVDLLSVILKHVGKVGLKKLN